MPSTDPPAIALRPEHISTLSDRVPTPSYDRESLQRSIVHIGVGGFHRAHLATYIDELAQSGSTEWGIVGAGIMDGDRAIHGALAEQDCLYTLVVRGEKNELRLIGSIIDYLLAVDDATMLVDTIASPVTQIVSLTVTEGGYPVDADTGQYLPDSPVAGPGSAFGIIAQALVARRVKGSGPLTVISCANVVGNGDASREATVEEARRIDPEAAEWVESNVTFPNSMVDRITPATTDGDRRWLMTTSASTIGGPSSPSRSGSG